MCGTPTGSCKMELAGAVEGVERVVEGEGPSCLLGVSGMRLRPTYCGLNSRCPNFFTGKDGGKTAVGLGNTAGDALGRSQGRSTPQSERN